MKNKQLTIVGGGLAGSEAAWQAAERGIKVALYEMRPILQTGAHQTGNLAELVCSNSLGSTLRDRGTGLLINELIQAGSLLIKTAYNSKVPAGTALAVDRQIFSENITGILNRHSNITIIREEVREIPDGVSIIASGPLTSRAFSAAISKLVGEENLFFFDAIAPIIHSDSIDRSLVFKSSRYERGEDEEGDYLNCPFSETEYKAFISNLVSAERVVIKGFEQEVTAGVRAGKSHFFERCLPVEVLASRGESALSYGPMRPVGLTDPRTGRWPYAVIQLRQENLSGDLYNLVGFQTNLTYKEQDRMIRQIPGLKDAEIYRYGQMHRNTFISSPGNVNEALQTIITPQLFLAGQIIGVEGYAGNIATGLVAGINATRYIKGMDLLKFPHESMIGSIISYVCNANPDQFQPMKANFGILPPIDPPRKLQKRQRYLVMAERAISSIANFIPDIDAGKQ